MPFKNDDDRKNPENDDNEESENWTQELRRGQEWKFKFAREWQLVKFEESPKVNFLLLSSLSFGYFGPLDFRSSSAIADV